MLIGIHNKLKSVNNLCICVKDSKIESVTLQKILGIYVDQHLAWDKKVTHVCRIINFKLFILKQVNYFLDDEMNNYISNYKS